MVKVRGRTYADLLKEMKDKVTVDEAVDVLSIRRGNDNELKIRVKDTKAAENF